MSNLNLNGPPYYDRFRENDNRAKLLFHADRYLQQSELNELQSIVEYNMRQLGDSVFNDGSMQAGMSFTIDEENGKMIIHDGFVYIAGKIRQFKEQSITFKGEGQENIGVKVVSRILDHNQDPTLLDPTQGVPSENAAGADRLIEEVELTYNDDTQPVIYEFTDGDLFIEPSRPDFSMINDVLATRTHEESGSYRVEGFNMWTEAHPTKDDMINLFVDTGTAYVMGYRIHKPTSSRIEIRKSRETHDVINETHTYDTATRKFRVGSTSVKEVKRVLARTESPAGGIVVPRGSTADGRDAIPMEYTSIDRNTPKIWTTSPAAEYQYTRDFTIVEENGIQYVNWATGPNGREPSANTSYRMSFEYTRQMAYGVDYQIATNRPEGDTPGWESIVDFNGMTGVKPKNGGLVSIDYDFYLTRKDLIMLDRTGRFQVVEGQPVRAQDAEAPDQEDPLALRIGIVTVFPNTHLSSTNMSSITRLRMEDLQKMKERLEYVEYNQSLLMLEMEATITENPLDLRGVFADGFINFDRMDKNLSSVAFSFDDASITLRTETPSDQMKEPKHVGNPFAKVWGRLVTAPYRERREISQPLASEAWNVNPYQVFNRQATLAVTPSSDNWIEEEKVTIVNEDVKAMDIARWWSWRSPNRQAQARRENEGNLGDVVWDDGNSLHNFRGAIGDQRTGVIESSAQNTTETAIDFMRQKDISFHAKNLLPMENNLQVTFDGKIVKVTPTNGHSAGSTDGTIRSNNRGEARGRFKIPSGVRTGTREVVIQNANNVGVTTYTAHGIRKRTEDVIFRTRVTATYYDPLAQSFIFPSDRVVTSLGLYFASKSRSNENIIVQIRGLSEGGYPNRNIYAERVLTPDDIIISDDGSRETRVHLDDPLMAESGKDYCIVCITDSMDYTMWVATLGNPRIDRPNEPIGTQPYVNGVLFSSSNARTWTAHQKSDMKFNVYTAEFEDEGVIEFETMTDISADKIMIMATFLTPANSGLRWDVKVVREEDVGRVSIDDVQWLPLINYLEMDTQSIGVIGLAKLRATFKSSRYMSPFLAMDDILFVNFVTATTGDYVSRNIDASDAPFNKVILAFDRYTPQGSSITPFYSLNGGQTWVQFKANPSIQTQSAEFERVTYNENISTNPTNRQLKLKLTLRGENRFVRPRARRLTAIMRDEINN